jgi:hypothetical protein
MLGNAGNQEYPLRAMMRQYLPGIVTITTDRDIVTQQYPDIAVIVPMQVLPGPLRRAAGRPKDEP